VQELDGHGPPPSIVAVAVVQFLGSLPFLYVCGTTLWGAVWVTHELAKSPMLIVVLGLPILFSLMAVVTSIGSYDSESGQEERLYLRLFPVSGCAFFLILYHPRDVYGAPFAVRGISHLVGKILLAILIPVSIWWWVLFTRNTVRSQFRRD